MRPGGVRERAQEVEDGRDPELPAHRPRVPHRGVERSGEHEPDPCIGQAPFDAGGIQVDPDAERLEEIGGSTVRGGGPVAVFGDRDAGARDDQGRDRRDVERAAPIPTRAARVDHRLRCFHGGGELEHRAGETVDLIDGLALRAEGEQERADLRRGRLAGHDLAHRLGRVLGPEVLPAREPQQQFRPEIGVRHEVREASSGCVQPSPQAR